MSSLPRHSSSAPVARTQNRQSPRQGWMAPPQGPHPRQWLRLKPQHGLHRAMRVMMGQLLLALGVSLAGHGAIATQSPPAIAQPVSAPPETPQPQSSVALPPLSPLAQNAVNSPAAVPDSASGESIQGDSLQGDIDQGDSEARRPTASQGSIYSPIRLSSGSSVEDTLTTQDIPLGQGSFARDYVVTLKANDQVAIDLFSDSFDTVVTLMSENGDTLGENDDGPDGGTNSLLFMRITEDGDYVVRVRGFGQAKGGPFKLKLTRLKAVQ